MLQPNENGSLNLEYVAACCTEIGKALGAKADYHVVVIRSTMLPGSIRTTVIPALEESSGKKVGKDLGLCINPEFLREGSSVYDFHNPPYTIVGAFDDRYRRGRPTGLFRRRHRQHAGMVGRRHDVAPHGGHGDRRGRVGGHEDGRPVLADPVPLGRRSVDRTHRVRPPRNSARAVSTVVFYSQHGYPVANPHDSPF